jgi:hypothetical protein
MVLLEGSEPLRRLSTVAKKALLSSSVLFSAGSRALYESMVSASVWLCIGKSRTQRDFPGRFNGRQDFEPCFTFDVLGWEGGLGVNVAVEELPRNGTQACTSPNVDEPSDSKCRRCGLEEPGASTGR